MSKVIVERPRKKPYGAVKGRQKNYDFEDMPTKESMSKKYGWHNKELNENLAPLKRFLVSKIGQPWNKVHSEICEHIRLDSAVQMHILQHLDHMIETRTYMEGNKVYIHSGLGDIPVGNSYRGELYVHPKTGLICRAEPAKWERKAKEVKRIDVSSLEQYHKIGGIWYSVSLKEIPKVPLYEIIKAEMKLERDGKRRIPFGGNTYRLTAAGRIVDFLLGRCIGYCVSVQYNSYKIYRSDLIEVYGREVYGVSKRQLNSRELRRAGLRND
jgi:hypothetical protein